MKKEELENVEKPASCAVKCPVDIGFELMRKDRDMALTEKDKFVDQLSEIKKQIKDGLTDEQKKDIAIIIEKDERISYNSSKIIELEEKIKKREKDLLEKNEEILKLKMRIDSIKTIDVIEYDIKKLEKDNKELEDKKVKLIHINDVLDTDYKRIKEQSERLLDECKTNEDRLVILKKQREELTKEVKTKISELEKLVKKKKAAMFWNKLCKKNSQKKIDKLQVKIDSLKDVSV